MDGVQDTRDTRKTDDITQLLEAHCGLSNTHILLLPALVLAGAFVSCSFVGDANTCINIPDRQLLTGAALETVRDRWQVGIRTLGDGREIKQESTGRTTGGGRSRGSETALLPV